MNARIVAYVPDLMDRSKVAAAAAAGTVTFVSDAAALAHAGAEADLVIVDLMRPGAVEAIGDLDVPVVGFANHTEREVMDAARAAGATTVLARSSFFSRLGELLDGDGHADS